MIKSNKTHANTYHKHARCLVLAESKSKNYKNKETTIRSVVRQIRGLVSKVSAKSNNIFHPPRNIFLSKNLGFTWDTMKVPSNKRYREEKLSI